MVFFILTWFSNFEILFNIFQLKIYFLESKQANFWVLFTQLNNEPNLKKKPK